MIRHAGAAYYNPDEAAQRILVANPGITLRAANGAAWREGERLLRRAIREKLDFAFETTLGGRSMTALLEAADDVGHTVHVWYAGLESPELHIARVRARVALGGHDIPEPMIRERYDSSRSNLIRLLPRLAELRLYDNSVEGDPARGETPKPRMILSVAERKIIDVCAPDTVPGWAKPIVMAALRLDAVRP